MDNSKLTKEAYKAQFLAGLITEDNIKKPEKELPGISSEPAIESPINPENTEIIKRVEELLNGSTYKLDVKPDVVNLRYKYWKKLPLGILAHLKSEFDVYEDTDMGDKPFDIYFYQIRLKK